MKRSLVRRVWFLCLGVFLASSLHPAGQIKPQLRGRQVQAALSCLIEIVSVSPQPLFSTGQVTVGYQLSLRLQTSERNIPITVGLFFNNVQVNSVRIPNFPNNETRRLFISGPVPGPGRYRLMVKVVKGDREPNLANESEVYGSGYRDVEIYEALPDLVVESFQVGQPEMRGEGNLEYVYFPFTAKVRNIGGAQAGRFAIGIFDGEESLQVVEGGTTPGPLPGGQSIQLTGWARKGTGRAQESFRLRAQADIPTREFSAGNIRELNEDNNFSSFVEVRFSYIEIYPTHYRGYRGGQIEILGTFPSLSDKKVVIRKGEINKAFCDVIYNTAPRIVIKIPKTDDLIPGENYELLIVDSQNRRLSNPANLYIATPLRLRQVKISESNYPGALINQRYGTMILEKDSGCNKISWALARRFPALDTDVFTENINSDTHVFIPDLKFSDNEFKTFINVVVRDACLVAFDDGCEGVSKSWVPIYNLFTEFIPLALAYVYVPSLEIHIDSRDSYIKYCVGLDCRSPNTEWKKIQLNTDPYNLTTPERYPMTGCDLKFWFRDINAKLILAREQIYNVSNGVVHLHIPFETGGPEEIGVDYWDCAGELPDINLSKFDIDLYFDLKVSWPITPDRLVKIIIGAIDIKADLHGIPDFLEEAFLGDLGGMIADKVRDRLGRALSDPYNKENIFNEIYNYLRNYLGSLKGVSKEAVQIMQIKPHATKETAVEVLYYIAR